MNAEIVISPRCKSPVISASSRNTECAASHPRCAHTCRASRAVRTRIAGSPIGCHTRRCRNARRSDRTVQSAVPQADPAAQHGHHGAAARRLGTAPEVVAVVAPFAIRNPAGEHVLQSRRVRCCLVLRGIVLALIRVGATGSPAPNKRRIKRRIRINRCAKKVTLITNRIVRQIHPKQAEIRVLRADMGSEEVRPSLRNDP